MLGILLLVAAATISVLAAGHALLTKRDPRSALAWIVVCTLAPGLGAALYWAFGINRIRTRARKYQQRRRGLATGPPGADDRPLGPAPSSIPVEYHPLVHTASAVARRPLVAGNRIRTLVGGDRAYPAMLSAIQSARSTVNLATYLFDADETGRSFIDALAEANQRGVEVRVLLDGFGQLMSRPPSRGVLRQAGVPCAEFLPLTRLGSRLHLNLRNHRKLLIVDQEAAFTGGMNIGNRHVPALAGARLERDLHFKVVGPVVSQMEAAFLEDWAFATGDQRELPPPSVPASESPALCRGISDGPNEDFEKLVWILLGACHAARERLRVMTPYFVPTRPLVSAFCAAALRGVRVEVVLPGTTDHPLVSWAARDMLGELLEHGVRVFLQPPPFDHTKLLVVDGIYSLVGSANLDPRSLLLNFEFNLEAYDRWLASELAEHFDHARGRSTPVRAEDLQQRSLVVKLRDAVAKLLSPYL